LTLESDSTKKTVTWGPFDATMTAELTFYHKTGDGASWDISAIEADQMKEVRVCFKVYLRHKIDIDIP